MRWFVALLGSVAVVLGAATQLSADVILPNLPAGSQYQLVFVTSGTRDATSSDIADYNTFVTQQAALSSSLPSATWYAIASTPTTNAIDNAPSTPSIPVYNTHGELVANASMTLYSGSLLHAIRYDQSGVLDSNIYMWTGSNNTGTASTELFFPGALGDAHPVFGYNYYDNGSDWLDTGADYMSPSALLPLYALSSPLTATPEPSTFVLLGVGAFGLLAYAWRKRGRTA